MFFLMLIIIFGQSHGPFYQVETGRKDGMVSDINLADKMPDVHDSIQLLKQKFIDKGLNDKDLVILSGNKINIYLFILFFE